MKETFYILKPSFDTEETGHVYPAVESYDDYNFKSSNSVHNLNHHAFPAFTPDIRFRLAKGAKLCDVMGQATISAYGILISERLKNSINELKIPPHRFYSAFIEDKGQTFNYYWLHIVWNDNIHLVDYSESSFFQKRGNRDLGDLTITSLKDYQNMKEQLGSRFMIGQKKLVLHTEPDYDMWTAPYRANIIINSKAKSFFENFTGILISEDETIKVQG
jgi:hypothetical protein